uniref:Uncharacterized protein n=1 Tax=Anguilla anguilla TaxID=7936 RepID=A0A0E9WK49_ANGAN
MPSLFFEFLSSSLMFCSHFIVSVFKSASCPPSHLLVFACPIHAPAGF